MSPLILRFGTAAAAILLAASLARAEGGGPPASACQDPGGYCRDALPPECLARIGAGSMPAAGATADAEACGDQFDAYRSCLAEVVAGCGDDTRSAAALSSPSSAASASALAVWSEIKDLGDADLLDMFAAEHAGTTLAALARQRADALRADSAADNGAAAPGPSTVFLQPMTSDGVGFSAGFVIAPDLILTAAHVVGADAGAKIRVGAPTLPGGETVAEILRLGVTDRGPSADLALLRAPLGGLAPLPLVGGVGSGESVVAFGFPGAVLSSDAPSQSFIRGQAGGAPPPASPLYGRVLALQTADDGARLVAHSAPLSPGTSGGPLTDDCGRVVGMNYGLVQSQSGGAIGLAIHTEEILRFLRAAGVSLALETEPCRP